MKKIITILLIVISNIMGAQAQGILERNTAVKELVHLFLDDPDAIQLMKETNGRIILQQEIRIGAVGFELPKLTSGKVYIVYLIMDNTSSRPYVEVDGEVPEENFFEESEVHNSKLHSCKAFEGYILDATPQKVIKLLARRIADGYILLIEMDAPKRK